ncbi:MAG: hypothetical protein EPO52_02790 [Herbiconiux sp.]|nr:MAG: hypothetical protein EPO52_02790 [Herbiconiux sp.]
MPTGDTVGTYEGYAEAQAAVERLAQSDFPLKSVSIIGSDLKTVEQVTGKRSYGRAALAGALSGLWLGLFFGLLLVLLSPTTTSALFLGAAALIGAGFGLFFNIAAYSINRRRRDFTSVMQVIATSYSVIVEPEHANRARNILESPEER